MQIRIQYQDGREECRTLDASQTLRFGTRRSAEVVLQGAGIFPIHFGIVYYRDAFTVAASKQARKVCVNGTRVRKTVLHDGDRIDIGPIVVTVVDEPALASQLESPSGGGKKPARRRREPQRERAWKDFDLPALSSDSLADSLGDLSEEDVGPLADISDDLLAAGAVHEDVSEHRARRHAGAPVDRTGPSAFLRVVQSAWFVRVLVACVVLPLRALIGMYIGQLPTADEQFQTADDAYRLEDFARATETFERFLARHPRHALADEARMKRDVARLLDRFDRGTDAMTLVNETRAAGRALAGPAAAGRCPARPGANPAAAGTGPGPACALPRNGARDTARDARACAAEGLQLIYEFLPAHLQRNGNVDQLQSALTSLERKFSQAAAVAEAVQKIDPAGAIGDVAVVPARRGKRCSATIPQSWPTAGSWSKRCAKSQRAAAGASEGDLPIPCSIRPSSRSRSASPCPKPE